MEKKPVKRITPRHGDPISWQKWLLIVPVILFLSALPVLIEYRDTGSVDSSRIFFAVILFFFSLIIAISATRKGKKK